MLEFSRIELYGVGDSGDLLKLAAECICALDPSNTTGSLKTGTSADQHFSLKDVEFCQLGGTNVGLRPSGNANGWLLRFPDIAEANRFSDAIRLTRKSSQSSIFEMRTDEASASQYFQVNFNFV